MTQHTAHGRARRALLASLLVGAGAVATKSHALAAPDKRSLTFFHTHTREQLSVTYYADGKFIGDALLEIDYLLRDFRTGDVCQIDAMLLHTLHDLNQATGGDGTFEVVSAYRSPATNASLQEHTEGVATNSMHLQGRAIDVRITGCDTARLRDAAVALQRGGVGYYPTSDFIHLDTGSVRTW
ncbi:MAG: DUF882 domain-containing protein [Betaproteobacteria bacterium]